MQRAGGWWEFGEADRMNGSVRCSLEPMSGVETDGLVSPLSETGYRNFPVPCAELGFCQLGWYRVSKPLVPFRDEGFLFF